VSRNSPKTPPKRFESVLQTTASTKAQVPPIRDRLGSLTSTAQSIRGYLSNIEGALAGTGESGKPDTPPTASVDHLFSDLEGLVENIRLRVEAIMVRI
jgi:hypothetical protein